MKPIVALMGIIAIGSIATSCATTKGGANWWLADFDKYDKNYRNFGTESIVIGMTVEETLSQLKMKARKIEESSDYQVYAYEKWIAVVGDDYIDEVLYLRFENGFLSKWQIKKMERNTINIPIIIWN